MSRLSISRVNFWGNKTYNVGPQVPPRALVFWLTWSCDWIICNVAFHLKFFIRVTQFLVNLSLHLQLWMLLLRPTSQWRISMSMLLWGSTVILDMSMYFQSQKFYFLFLENFPSCEVIVMSTWSLTFKACVRICSTDKPTRSPSLFHSVHTFFLYPGKSTSNICLKIHKFQLQERLKFSVWCLSMKKGGKRNTFFLKVCCQLSCVFWKRPWSDKTHLRSSSALNLQSFSISHMYELVLWEAPDCKKNISTLSWECKHASWHQSYGQCKLHKMPYHSCRTKQALHLHRTIGTAPQIHPHPADIVPCYTFSTQANLLMAVLVQNQHFSNDSWDYQPTSHNSILCLAGTISLVCWFHVNDCIDVKSVLMHDTCIS